MLKYSHYPLDKLMIVAHPDDELIFGGAQLIKETGWKVICVTNGNYPVRKSEFIKVMHELQCEFEIWSYPDSASLFDPIKLTKDLRKAIKRNYIKIVTHNKNGEYGHIHHIQIHEILASMDVPLWVFDEGEPLPESIWNKKSTLLEYYKSQRDVCDKFLERAKHESVKLLIRTKDNTKSSSLDPLMT